MIVDYAVDSDILAHAREAAPEMMLRLERMDGSDRVPLRNVFWASGGNFEAFEDALDDDDTVSGVRRLARTDGARLYSAHYDETLPDVAAYRTTLELGGVVLDAHNEGGVWHVRFQFPDRRAAREFQERADQPGFELTLRAVYQQEFADPPALFNLTDTQRETLRTAASIGYFHVPRDASLAEVSDRMGVSKQATSERLRRGIDALVRSTIGVDPEGNTAEGQPNDRS